MLGVKLDRIAKLNVHPKQFMLIRLLRLFAKLPLPLIHGLGVMVGWFIFITQKKVKQRSKVNLQRSALFSDSLTQEKVLRKSVSEAGKAVIETLAIWFRPHALAVKWVKEVRGWEHVDAVLAQNKGLIFLTPHLGCFEIIALYYASKHPIHVLYRPPRKSWLAPLIQAGRVRSQMNIAPTNMSGVRLLLKKLRAGEAIGILPDQVPAYGEGVWANFFGQPAYTMNLVHKLATTTGAPILMAFGERLSWGRGYIFHIEPLNTGTSPEEMNLAIERLIARCPAQYLWSYDRYKQPRGTPITEAQHNPVSTDPEIP